ncbi:three-Cys-motif partner protein TcmP [Candidatus Bathyarchaeota archaeon]|nr:three-Cys-motif partner protein TcmP [Candidatus Bathyarchaeota archaeon]
MNTKHELELKEKNISKLLLEKGMVVCNKHYPGHPWSLVKLVLLGTWAYVYTSIMKKNWRGRIRYIDLLAGSGTTEIVETGDIIKGSPFAVLHFALKPFDDYILIERNKERYKALKQNSKLLGRITEPKQGDCNKLIKDLFNDPFYHNLVFVDMEGFDLTWENMEYIIGTKSDIIINFPTSSFERTAALENQHCLDEFFGDNSWVENALDREEFLRFYMEKLKTTFFKKRRKTPYVESIRVGKGSYFYDMILVCKNGNYINAWQYAKEKWNGQNPQEMTRLLDHLKGRAPRLDDF